MREFLRENICDYFNDGFVSVTKGDFVRTPVTRVRFSRNEELHLVLELTSPGWREDEPEGYAASTVRLASEVIKFDHAAGWVGAARGVVGPNNWSSSKRGGEAETLETYSVHSIELNFQRQVQSSYVVEWVANVPGSFAWNEPVRFSIIETSTKSVGSGAAEIRMTKVSKSSGGNKALHLTIAGVDLYVMRSIDQDESGKIQARSYTGTALIRSSATRSERASLLHWEDQ
jgi:hypothetical protein